MSKSKWIKVGQVCVDTGTLLLCDPCQTEDAYSEGMIDMEDTMQIRKEDRNSSVAVRTGWGDGFYNVEVRMDAQTGRVAELRVKFM